VRERERSGVRNTSDGNDEGSSFDIQGKRAGGWAGNGESDGWEKVRMVVCRARDSANGCKPVWSDFPGHDKVAQLMRTRMHCVYCTNQLAPTTLPPSFHPSSQSTWPPSRNWSYARDG